MEPMDQALVVDFEVKKCSSTGGGAAAGPPGTLYDRPQHFFRAAPPSRYTVAVRQKYFLDPVDDRRLLLRSAEGAARARCSHAREQCGARRAAAAPPAWLAVKPQPAASSFINGRWMEAIGGLLMRSQSAKFLSRLWPARPSVKICDNIESVKGSAALPNG